MVDLAEIQAAYYIVAATGVLVAAIYYVLNLRISQRRKVARVRYFLSHSSARGVK